MFTIDAHCDTVLHMHDPAMAQSPPPHHLSFDRLPEGGGLQWMACFPLRGMRPYELVTGLLDTLDAAQAEAGLPTVTNAARIKELAGNRSWGVLRSVEGGEALENDLSRMDELYARGVRSVGLTWNHPNALSGGSETPDQGLTAFGREVIERMETLGMAVDLAHISAAGFWGAIDMIKRPAAVSHACCAALCEHRRNLNDQQIRALAERGGVMGVCLCSVFLNGTAKADTDDVVKHFMHLRNIGGRECVGLGSDFDGIDVLPSGITGAADIYKLWDALSKAGVPASDIELMAHGNWTRLLTEIL